MVKVRNAQKKLNHFFALGRLVIKIIIIIINFPEWGSTLQPPCLQSDVSPLRHDEINGAKHYFPDSLSKLS